MGWVSDIIDTGLSWLGLNEERKHAENMADDARQGIEEQFWRERGEFKLDRKNDRRYARRVTERDREYVERMLGKDRRYEAEQFAKRRQNDRQYLAKLTDKDREYMEGREQRDRKLFRQDNRRLQEQSNRMVDRNVESRGIDFQKLRDDAVAAGYNPMTALGMAHAYSTETNYNPIGQPYTGGANYNVTSGQAGTGGAPTPSGGGGRAGSNVAAGSFGFSGSGYAQAQTTPSPLAAGAHLARAFNPEEVTPYNQSAVMLDQEYDLARSRIGAPETPQSFGYDITKVQPYNPAASYSTAELGGYKLTPRDQRAASDFGTNVPEEELTIFGLPWKDYSNSSDAASFEDREGDFLGGAIRAVPGIYNTVRNVNSWLPPALQATRTGNPGLKPRTEWAVEQSWQNPTIPPGQYSYATTGREPKGPVLGAQHWGWY